jgi:nucleoid DNA-binding protein
MDAIAERVWTKLIADARRASGGETKAEIPGLGRFTVRTYKAYDGRNPRTGEPVHVPAKALPFFQIDQELAEHLNGHGAAPRGAEAILDELRAGRPVVLGALGGLELRRKLERTGIDPETEREVVIPSRVIVTFVTSEQLTRALAGEPPASVMTARAVDEAFASVDEVSPVTTLDALDAAFEKLAMEHEVHGIVPPDEREEDADGATALSHDEDRWYIRDGHIVELRGDGEHAFDVARWAQDVLTVAVINEVARRTPERQVLGVGDARRVIARLSPEGPMSLRDLPF